MIMIDANERNKICSICKNLIENSIYFFNRENEIICNSCSEKERPIYSPNKENTISYIREILEELVRVFRKIDKINKDWSGINRYYETIIFRAKELFEPMRMFLEEVFFGIQEDQRKIDVSIDNKTKLYLAAIDKWTKEAQREMVIEEMAELTQRIQHLKRNRCGPNDLCEEIADVEITLEQLKIMYGIEINCYNYKQSKLRMLKLELKK